MKNLEFNKKKKKNERKFHSKLVNCFQNDFNPKTQIQQLRPLLSKVKINCEIDLLVTGFLFHESKKIVDRIKL